VKTVIEIADAVRARRLDAVGIVEECLARIAAHNEGLRAFVYLDAKGARRAAAELMARVGRGEDPGPLAGVPFGVKDIRDSCAGMPRRNGSLFHMDDAPETQDSPFIARLRAAGAIPLGKVATAEFGMDGVTHTLAHGTTRNPWNLERTPGGSSGGSAAAVAAGLVPFCTAGDAGGSTRSPAGYTGTVGLKPSVGRIPRPDGFSDRMTPGVITTTVADTARLLDVAAGPHDRDRMTLPGLALRYESIIDSLSVAGLRAAWSVDLGFAPIEPEIARITQRAAERLIEAAELQRVERSVELTNVYMAANMHLTKRFAAELEHRGILPGQEHRLSPGPRWFLAKARAFTQDQVFAALESEKKLERELAELFRDIDVLLTPCHSTEAFAAAGPLPERIAGRDASETHGDAYPMVASIGWNPSISVPAGITASGLPVGLLVTVRRHRDDVALRLARILESVDPWPRLAPGWDVGAASCADTLSSSIGAERSP
jgi:aspartyl-tRNA(Asn)/glutamyl-tRNA(Gln) amidotransferase subunit A